MASHLDLRESIPPDGIYIGSATVGFRAPDGDLSGPAKLFLSPSGHIRIEVEIEHFNIPPEYRGMAMAFLSAESPKLDEKGRTVFGLGETRSTASIEVRTNYGLFRGGRALLGSSHFDLMGNSNSSITIVPTDLEFAPSIGQPAHTWCLPLFGKVDSFHGAETASSLPHREPYLSFHADGMPCGLRILHGQKDNAPEFSAFAFGLVANKPTNTVTDIQELLPAGLLTVLSFAAGSDIHAPWVDLRTADGRLRGRFHLRMGMNREPDNSPALSRLDSTGPGSGLGAFLNCYFSLPLHDRLSLIPPLNLIRSGAPGSSGTVDATIADLVKALDALCKIHKLTHQKLLPRLNARNAAEAEKIVAGAREALKYLRRQSQLNSELDQLPVLDKIVSKQANVVTEERDFGLAVSDLLKKFGLFDADAMGSYYRSIGSDVTWEGLLSFVRGQVIHSAAIPMQSSRGLLAWFEFARHLHDICKRIILKQTGYCGTYAASNVIFSGQYQLDRVTANSTPRQLGYTVPPAPHR